MDQWADASKWVRRGSAELWRGSRRVGSGVYVSSKKSGLSWIVREVRFGQWCSRNVAGEVTIRE